MHLEAAALPSTPTISVGWKIASRILPLVPHARAAVSRGLACFSVPWRKTVIVVPSRALERDLEVPQRSVSSLQAMFYALGFQPDKQWQVVYAGDDAVQDDLRRQNLLVLGGPVINPFTRELLKRDPAFLEEIEFVGDDSRREFLWRNRRFTWSETSDYVLVAVRRNPFMPTRRTTLLFGLREIGTWAATRVFADREYDWLRKEIHQQHSSRRSQVEVLLRVDHTADQKKISEVRIAKLKADGDPLVGAGACEDVSAATIEASLEEIATSLKSHPRKVVFSDVRHTVRVGADYSQAVEEEMTWKANGTDIVHYVKQYAGSSDLGHLQSLRFTAEVVDGTRKLVAVPTLNLPRKKRFLLFPVPPVRSTEPGGVRVRISATWPRAFDALATVGGTDEFVLRLSPLQVAEIVDRLTIRVEFEPRGARFRVVEQFEVPAGHVNGQEFGELKPYEITISNAAPGTEYAFQLRHTG